VGKGGVVRDPLAHVDAIVSVMAAAAELGMESVALIASPITGPAGNHEYLLRLASQRHGAQAATKPQGPGLDPADHQTILKLVRATLAGDAGS
jgi:23S rRNA (cytidine1920-2'-O)/16S rRNA (cytidine1409-2'-O)-methyltransferase